MIPSYFKIEILAIQDEFVLLGHKGLRAAFPHRDFLRMLIHFPKPLIAGVNGSAMGLGVTMLPLFDMVYAADNAEFYLPYYKLGQVPRGGRHLHLPQPPRQTPGTC